MSDPMTPDAAGRPGRIEQPLYRRATYDEWVAEWWKMRDRALAAESEVTRLRAEVEALLPLAQAGLAAFDYAMAKEQYGTAILPRLDRVAIAESLTAARALLGGRE